MRNITILLIVTTMVGPLAAQRSYKSKKHGFSLKVISDFREIPVRRGEKWILAKWQSKRPYYYSSEQGFSYEHKPMLRVLAFPKGLDYVETEKLGDTTIKTSKYPYRNYKDYLKRHHSGGGWFISKEADIKLGGVEATYMEVSVTKLTNAPRITFVCVYHLEDRDLAVEVDILEQNQKKLRSPYRKSVRSLKAFKAAVSAKAHHDKEDLPSSGITGGSATNWNKRRAERKRAWKRRLLEEAGQDLPSGWKKIETKEFLVLTHASPRYTQRLLSLAKGVRSWMDKNFSTVGKGEVMKSIIRICADYDEARAYQSGSGDSYSYESGEVVCAGGADLQWDSSRLANAIAEQYLSEKNPALWRALPDWIRTGLGNYIGSARFSSSKGLKFAISGTDASRCKIMLKKDTLPHVRDLLAKIPPQMTSGKFDFEAWRDYNAAVDMFVRYLLEGPGRKGKTKQLLARYISKAVEILDKTDEDEWSKVISRKVTSKEAMTEEEEEEEWKKRRSQSGSEDWGKQFAERKQALLKDAHEAGFNGWTDKDWDKLNKSFRRYLR